MSDTVGKPTLIEAQHLQIMQEIVDFLQSRGWDVNSMGIDRYDASQGMFEGEEEWKAKVWKWQVSLTTSPRDQQTLPVRAPETA